MHGRWGLALVIISVLLGTGCRGGQQGTEDRYSMTTPASGLVCRLDVVTGEVVCASTIPASDNDMESCWVVIPADPPSDEGPTTQRGIR